jgi:chondroitin-sulfate-ABC endolyase/exolyase
MKNSCFIVLFLLGIIPSAFAQLIGFEEEVPKDLQFPEREK